MVDVCAILESQRRKVRSLAVLIIKLEALVFAATTFFGRVAVMAVMRMSMSRRSGVLKIIHLI